MNPFQSLPEEDEPLLTRASAQTSPTWWLMVSLLLLFAAATFTS